MIELLCLYRVFCSITIFILFYILSSSPDWPTIEPVLVDRPYLKHYHKHFVINAPEVYENNSLVEAENLVYCHISSNMQSRLLSLFVRYHTDDVYDISNGEIETVLDMYNDTIPHVDTSILNSTKSAFAIIRDPVDRFISSFYHVCYRLRSCVGPDMGHCGWNLGCILVHLQNFNNIGGYWPQLGNYQFSPISHFIPQTYFCRFRQYKNKYRLFHYNDTDEFKSEISDFLVTNGMPKRLLESGWGDNGDSNWLNTSGYRHTRELFKGQLGEVVDNPEVINTIYLIYQLDYQFFNLPPPATFVQKYCYLPQYRYHLFCRDALDK